MTNTNERTDRQVPGQFYEVASSQPPRIPAKVPDNEEFSQGYWVKEQPKLPEKPRSL